MRDTDKPCWTAQSLNCVCIFTARAVAFGENLTGDAYGAFSGEKFLERWQTFFGDAAQFDGYFDLLVGGSTGPIRG